MKEISDGKLTKNLDTHWSKLVKKQAGNKCEVCGSTENLNSHHIIGRRNYRLRWELMNGACLCTKHHKFGNESAHENPVWFDEWLRKNRSEDYGLVRSVMWEIKKWTRGEKEELLQEFKKELKAE